MEGEDRTAGAATGDSKELKSPKTFRPVTNTFPTSAHALERLFYIQNIGKEQNMFSFERGGLV